MKKKIFLDPDGDWGWFIYDEDTERVLVAMNCVGFKTSDEAEQHYKRACSIVDDPMNYEDMNGLQLLTIPDCCGQVTVYLTKEKALNDFDLVRDYMRRQHAIPHPER